MIVADTSPLIVLGRLNRLDILRELFGTIVIPSIVYQEAVVGSKFQLQRESILRAIEEEVILVKEPTIEHEFNRRLDAGEMGVLHLALEIQANALIMDDRKARNEAKEMGFMLFYTTDILKGAERKGLIDSYIEIVKQLASMKIYLPE